MKQPIEQVELYGQDQSPWVQAVLLGLYEKNIICRLTTVPPLPVFGRWGVLMPAVKVNGAPWRINTVDILQKLGFSSVAPEDLKAIRIAWLGVTHRARDARRFFIAASHIRDPNPVLWRQLGVQFLRSFVVLYFYVLLTFVRLTGLQRDPENFADQFLYWERKLQANGSRFLGGDFPDALDLLLFGMIQCHCSIPVPPVEALQQDQKLAHVRAWITSMQTHFAGYPHLYSGVYFEPHAPQPTPATPLEKTAFWTGLGCMLLAFPITLPAILLLALRVPRK